jgi:hypothetical protein
MALREGTGYLAHVLLAQYWIWVISTGASRLRPGRPDRGRALRILAVKSAGVILTALLVGVIHYWATQWWHVVGALVLAATLAVPLHREYRRLVAAPRHRLTLRQRTLPGPRPGPTIPRNGGGSTPHRVQ